MGVNPAAAAPAANCRYRRIGQVLVPCAGGAAVWYWRHLHAWQRLPRRSWLSRWRHEAGERVAWAEAVQARLEGMFGPSAQCVWRPAAPGVSRASLGWVVCEGELRALVRVARDSHCAFLERELHALRFVVSLPELASSTPRLLAVERDGDTAAEGARLMLIESACTGTVLAPGRAAVPAPGAAAWLACFQASTCAGAIWSNTALLSALDRTPAFTARARERLRACALEAPPAAQVAAHGDFWWGNILQGAAAPIAVVDWSEFRPRAHRFHDAGFYLLTWGRDWVGPRLPPGEWLRRGFAPGAKFLALAAAWFARYQEQLAASGWNHDCQGSFAALLRHLPLVMAHYACYGQQAAAWAAACNAWAEADSLGLG